MSHRRLLPVVFLMLAAAQIAAAQGRDSSAGDPSRNDSMTESYRIGVEDELRIFVWGESDLSGNFRVLPDGTISLPLVHDIPVAGLTTGQVRKAVAEALGKYVRDPNVTVIVEAINSYRVYFLGQVGRQGALQFYRPTRLMQGIAAAGGLTEFAKKEITLIRDQGGGETRFRIDYKRLVGGDPSQENIYLEPGDTLIFH